MHTKPSHTSADIAKWCGSRLRTRRVTPSELTMDWARKEGNFDEPIFLRSAESLDVTFPYFLDAAPPSPSSLMFGSGRQVGGPSPLVTFGEALCAEVGSIPIALTQVIQHRSQQPTWHASLMYGCRFPFKQ